MACAAQKIPCGMGLTAQLAAAQVHRSSTTELRQTATTWAAAVNDDDSGRHRAAWGAAAAKLAAVEAPLGARSPCSLGASLDTSACTSPVASLAGSVSALDFDPITANADVVQADCLAVCVPDVCATPACEADTPVFVPLLGTPRLRFTFVAAVLLAAAAAVHVTVWWLRAHPGGPRCVSEWLPTLTLLYEVAEGCVCLALILRARVINPALPPPPRLRAAMVATKAPSEPLSVLQRTLDAMLAQDYPYSYDVWLADEAPDADTRAWCAERGVRISSRQGVEEYHRPTWPRRTRCKEGNLAYFYDHYGYDLYDVVAQFDADHVPQHDYLTTALPAFDDPQVGYVACPSICDANASVSWAVRGRLYDEAYFHGPWGASMAGGLLPTCIGSHYLVRTAHLRAAGGIGPELDEDMSTSYILTANGYRGAFSLHSIAHGDGPATFEDAMRQEYQWARSAMVILTRYLYPWWSPAAYTLTIAERVRVLHWMAFWILRAAWAVALPVLLALLALRVLREGRQPLLALPLRVLPYYAACVLHWWLARRQGWLRPTDATMGWELFVHKFVRPYWIAMGVVHGLAGGLLGVRFDIKVTPKGPGGERLMSPANVAPLLAVSALGFLAVLPYAAVPGGATFVLSYWLMGVLHAAAAALVVALHYAENHAYLLPYWRRWHQLRANAGEDSAAGGAAAAPDAAVPALDNLLHHAVVFAGLGLLAGYAGAIRCGWAAAPLVALRWGGHLAVRVAHAL